MYMAGVPRGVSYRNGIEISRVAAIHETWSRLPGKPYRPLWIYTFNKDMKGEQGVSRLLNKTFKRLLRAKGYPVSNLKF